MSKYSELLELLQKGRKAEVGEVRTWASGTFMKHGDGWIYMSGPNKGKAMGKVKEAAKYLKFLEDTTPTGDDAKDSVEDKKTTIRDILKDVDLDSVDEEAKSKIRAILMDFKKEDKPTPEKKEEVKTQVDVVETEGKVRVETKKIEDKSPREVAESLQSDEEYFNARDSKISNQGEDLFGSARHKRGMSLQEMEDKGIASKEINKTKLMKNSSLEYVETGEHADFINFAAFMALKGVGGKPVIEKRFDEDQQKLARKVYHEAFTEQMDIINRTIAKVSYGLKEGLYEIEEPRKQYKLLNLFNEKFREEGKKKHIEITQEYKASSDKDKLLIYKNKDEIFRKAHNGSVGYKKNNANGVLHRADTKIEETGNPNEVYKKVYLEGLSVEKALGIQGPKRGSSGKPKGFKLTDFYGNEADREGGESVGSTLKEHNDYMVEKAGLRGIQFGNSLPDDERAYHLQKSAEAFKDLTDILDLPDIMGSFNGKLGLAIGARGRAGAMAHYEPGTKVINLTRKSGVGSLAHEWGHMFDNVVAKLEGSSEDPFLSESSYWDKTVKVVDGRRTMVNANEVSDYKEVREAFAGLVKSDTWDEYKKHVRDYVRATPGMESKEKYWTSGKELFARAFEAHVSNKLDGKDRKNTYLAEDKNRYDSTPVYPSGGQIDALGPMFDKIFAAFKDSDLINKAMEYFDAPIDTLKKKLTSEMSYFCKRTQCQSKTP